MKFTWKWLLDHLETDKNISEILETLPKLGLEVASIVNLAEDLKSFISVEIIDVKKHPNADKLNVCKVFDGENTFNVVCGAPNVELGMKSVFASIGTFIPGLNLKLKKGKIRGEESFGMLCSEKELNLSENHSGIIELESSAELGLSVSDIMDLNDPIIEIEITPNRGDCLGVRGIARDLAAAGIGNLRDLDIIFNDGEFDSIINWKIDLDKDEKYLCPKVFGRSFVNLKNDESPLWLKNRLTAVDQRPISSIVDITNYIMIDIGRPLHAYDIDKIKGTFLKISKSKKGDNFSALNGNTYELDDNMLVISDEESVDDLAGIMGGERTGVTKNTTKMFLEAAIFDQVSIANTGRKLNLNSDARYRFERGLDYNSPEMVMHYASAMINKICGGKSSKIVNFKIEQKNRIIKFDPNIINQLTGVKIENELSKSILEKLGFKIVCVENIWDITPPSWRPDIDGIADIVEEIIRINGYDKIPSIKLSRSNYIAKPAMSIKHRQAFFASRILANRGYNEVITFSFLNKEMADQFNGGGLALNLVNPISSEMTDMRPSIIPNLLSAVQKNVNIGAQDLSFFETGPIFKGDSPNEQISTITGIRYGDRIKKDWQKEAVTFDFYDIKLDVLKVLDTIGVPKNSLKIFQEAPEYFHPGRSAVFKIGQNIIANLGEVHPEIGDAFGLNKSAIGFEIFYENIPLPKRNKISRPMLKTSNLQPVTREFAFLINDEIESDRICQIAKSINKDLITDVKILDIYKGEKIPQEFKSIAIKVTIQPIQETLTDAALEEISADIINAIEKKLSGSLREI